MTEQEQLRHVHVDLEERGYDVIVGTGSLAALGQHLLGISSSGRAVLIADERVVDAGLHHQAVRSCEIAGIQWVMMTVPEGEGSKSISQAERLYSELVSHRIERGTPLVALGGGVTGDLAGFVAATYLRGIPFVQCPTTLLSMVDSSVGGKVAVNLPAGKNLVGAFYQPRIVIIDTATLATLPLRELRCGLAECIKHGLGLDAALYEWTESNIAGILQQDPPLIVELVRRNVALKAAIVVEDEKEAGRRALLNLGHTFAHAIEGTTGYSVYKHGEAVALGTLAACALASRLGRLESHVGARFADLLERIGLPRRAGNLPADSVLIEAMSGDKKVENGQLRFVLPTAIGRSEIVSDVPIEEICVAWQSIR
jgi:3-dehydroquinate synthase